MVEVTAVVEAKATGPLKVLKPVKTLFAASLASVALSVRLAEERPVIVVPVRLRLPVTAKLVEVRLEIFPLVPEMLVEVREIPFAFVKPSNAAAKLVEVALVKVVLPKVV